MSAKIVTKAEKMRLEARRHQVETEYQRMHVQLWRLNDELIMIAALESGNPWPARFDQPYNPEEHSDIGEGYRLLTWAEVLQYRHKWRTKFPEVEKKYKHVLESDGPEWCQMLPMVRKEFVLSLDETYRIPCGKPKRKGARK